MTDREKQLLLKDLCARLPYKVKCPFNCKKGVVTAQITDIDLDQGIISYIPEGSSIAYCSLIYSDTFDFKPYLRPMSSMTNKEKGIYRLYVSMTKIRKGDDLTLASAVLIDWLYSHHLDFRGLIPIGLALEAPADMYK